MQKAVWLTGAGSGIGKALAFEFSAYNIPLVISGRNEERLNSVKNEIMESGRGCEVEILDITSSDSVYKSYNRISQKFKIEYLVNNAGVTRFKSAENHSLDEIDRIISTNLTGSIYMIKSVLPEMIKENSGTIVNILSVAAEKTFTNSSVYAASKAGLAAFAKGLREELKASDIRVINIYPGATKTEMWHQEALDKFSDRMMSPTELAKFVCGICVEKNSVVTEEITLRPLHGDL